MGKSSPSPPPAPDYAGAAQAQGAANVEAARVAGKFNNPNVISPLGTQNVSYGSFDQAGFDKVMNDYNNFIAAGMPTHNAAGQLQLAPPNRADFTINADQPTLTQAFSPEQQQLYEQSTRVKGLLGGLGEQGATSLQGVVGKNLDFSGVPTSPSSYADTRKSVIDAMMSRVNEDTDRTKDQANSDLIAAGLRPGTSAYDDRMALIERGRTDARQQAIAQAGSEESRAFGMDTERRRQAITEMLAQRQVPLNEITALMSGSQVSNPFAVPEYSQNAQVAPAPVFGATNAAGQYGTDVYNQQVGSQNAMTSGLFGLGSAGLFGLGAKYSDRRLKSNIRRIGTHPLGIGIYEYNIFGRREIGVMAQELARVKPEAVVEMSNGYWAVRYDLIGGRPNALP